MAGYHPQPFKDVEKRKGGQVAGMLLVQETDVVFLHRSLSGSATGYAFGAAGIGMKAPPAEVIEVL